MQLPQREIVVDTETTGLDPGSGHRVVEVGCVELVNLIPTGRSYQKYLNPERDMPVDAFQVHGLAAEFLAPQPLFAQIADEFLDFLGEAPLVIHNAAFDLKFINAELTRLERPPLAAERAVDTLALARRRFPGARASLDALCQRFGIDLSGRSMHGALLDANLLSEVYLALRGGPQPKLDLGAAAPAPKHAPGAADRRTWRQRNYAPSDAERAAHARMLESMKSPLWDA